MNQSSRRSFLPTKSIPIHKSRQDIIEELEVQEQEMLADFRDNVMFHRIVNGMIAKRCAYCGAYTNSCYHSETEKCIASIMRTRYKDTDAAKFNEDQDVRNEESCFFGDAAAAAKESDQPPEDIFILDM